MALAHDAQTQTAAFTSADSTTTHTPVGTPAGAVVIIVQNGSLTDQIGGVTYGGVAMTRQRFDTLNDSTDAAVYCYTLNGVDTPAGAQSVVIDSTGASSKRAVISTFTAGAGMTGVYDSGATAQLVSGGGSADPAVTVNFTGTLASAVLYAGVQVNESTPDSVMQSGSTSQATHDFGSQSGKWARSSATAVASRLIGWNPAIKTRAFVIGAVAFSEVTAGQPLPLAAATGAGSGVLGLTGPPSLVLAAAAGAGTGALGLAATALLALGASSGQGGGSLGLTVPTSLGLNAGVGAGAGSLGLTAPTKLPLAAAQGAGSGSLVLETKPFLSLSAQGHGSGSLGLTVPTSLSLAPAVGIGAGSMVLSYPQLLALAAAVGQGSGSMKLNANALLLLAAAGGQGAGSVLVTTPAPLVLAAAAGKGTASMVLSLAANLALAASQGQGAGALGLIVVGSPRDGVVGVVTGELGRVHGGDSASVDEPRAGRVSSGRGGTVRS